MTGPEYLQALKDTYDVLIKGWITAKDLAKKTNTSHQTPRTHMRVLEEIGFTVEEGVVRQLSSIRQVTVFRIKPLVSHQEFWKKAKDGKVDLTAVVKKANEGTRKGYRVHEQRKVKR